MDRQRKDRASSCECIAGRGSVRFSELFETPTSRSEVVCTFLALLELIRLKQLVVRPAGSRSPKSKSAARRDAAAPSAPAPEPVAAPGVADIRTPSPAHPQPRI